MLTLAGLLYIPKKLRLWEPKNENDDENAQLLKTIGLKRRRQNNKKQ